MARSAGTVQIVFQAGTAGFVADVAKAKSAVKDFGSGTKFNMAESSAAVKALEGNFTGTTRAVSRFLSVTLGLGPVLRAAFPVIGAVLLGKAIFDTGEKVYEFYKKVRDAAEQIKGTFRDLNAPLRTTNDEMRVTNARLEQEIAKLEGKRQNTLALALAEARKAADDLADSLDKDLSKLDALLKEQSHNKFAQMFGAPGAPSEVKEALFGETGFGGYRAKIDEINDIAYAQIAAAKGKTEIDAAEKKRNAALLEQYGKMLEYLNRQKGIYQDLAHPKAPVNLNPGGGTGFIPRDFSTGTKIPDQKANLEVINALIRNIHQEMERVPLGAKTEELTARKQELEAQRDAIKLTKPFEDKIRALDAQIVAVKSKIASIGLGPEAEAMAQGWGRAVEAISEINKGAKTAGERVSYFQAVVILNKEQILAQKNAEEQWKNKLQETTVRINEQIRSQEMLTAAVGKGYAAVRAASVETSVMKERGPLYGRGGAEGAAAEARLRDSLSADYDAKERDRAANAVNDLGIQINLENRLAEAQRLGAEEIERITAMETMRAAIARGASGAELMALNEAFYARKRNEDAHGVATIEAETEAEKRLAQAVVKGAEAIRLQTLENKYAEMERTGKGAEVPAARIHDETVYQKELTEQALKTGMEYQDEVETLLKHIAVLREILAANKDNVAASIALRKANDELLAVIVRQKLEMGSLRDGMEAFFLEMQRQAKKPGQILYDGLTSALDQTADQLAKLFTGQKTSFGKMFQGLGEQMLKDSIKAELQKGIGAIGERLGIKAPSIKKPTGNPGDPVHVFVDNNGSGGSTAGGGSGGPGRIFGGASGVPGIFNFGGARAMGGPVNAGMAYMVGERGPEPFVPATNGTVYSSRMGVGGSGPLYIIDARGGDEAAIDRRVRAALVQVHGSAVATSVQAQQDRMRRVPGGY